MNELLREPGQLYRDGSTTPMAVLDACSAAIIGREREVKAFTALNLDGAWAAAEASASRWAAGKPLSPIDGMVVGVKDVIETADMPTGQGSPIWEGFQTRRDAASVQALREAGAVILGKTTTTEFATRHSFFDTRNPRDTSRTPGGSSSGSAAAVGAGMVEGALGTQVVGSILRPSSYCGVVGYKPSFGALNRGGSNDQLSQSCLGTIASTLSGAWAMAAAIAERVGGDPGQKALHGGSTLPAKKAPRRLALLETAGWSQRSPGATLAIEAEIALLEGAGVEVVRNTDDPKLAELETQLLEAWTLTEQILSWEFAWPLRSYPFEKLSLIMQARREAGLKLSVAEYEGALGRRDAIRQAFSRFASHVDGFVALSATGAAPNMSDNTGSPAMNVPASLLGVPAVSLPLLQDQGLPLGLQLIGNWGKDAELMGLARWRIEIEEEERTHV